MLSLCFLQLKFRVKLIIRARMKVTAIVIFYQRKTLVKQYPPETQMRKKMMQNFWTFTSSSMEMQCCILQCLQRFRLSIQYSMMRMIMKRKIRQGISKIQKELKVQILKITINLNSIGKEGGVSSSCSLCWQQLLLSETCPSNLSFLLLNSLYFKSRMATSSTMRENRNTALKNSLSLQLGGMDLAKIQKAAGVTTQKKKWKTMVVRIMKKASASLEDGLRVGMSPKMIRLQIIERIMMMMEIRVPRAVPSPGLLVFYSSILIIGKQSMAKVSIMNPTPRMVV